MHTGGPSQTHSVAKAHGMICACYGVVWPMPPPADGPRPRTLYAVPYSNVPCTAVGRMLHHACTTTCLPAALTRYGAHTCMSGSAVLYNRSTMTAP